MSDSDRNVRELLAALRALFAAAPWVAMEIMFILTPEQWAALLSGEALELLMKDAKQRSLPALAAFRLPPSKYADDIAQEVLLKLTKGRFLKRYNPARKHPRAYLMGSAYQYARTIARSFWRGDARARQLHE